MDLSLSVTTRGFYGGDNKGIKDTGGILIRGSPKCPTKSVKHTRKEGRTENPCTEGA